MGERNHSILVFSCVFALLMLCVRPQQAVAQSRCGTELTPQQARLALQNQREGRYSPPAGAAGGFIVVPVTLHAVRNTGGWGGFLLEDLEEALEDANDIFFPATGIFFCQRGYGYYLSDDDFFYNIDSMEEIDALRMIDPVPDTLNIYITYQMADETGPLCEASSFTFSEVQGIVVSYQCDSSSLIHAIGHYFDLFDTHETNFGLECADGSNCDVAGDLLCDTPADPGLNADLVSEDCVYTGDIEGPCEDDALYAPDVSNYMSAAPSSCRDSFTAQQQERILATLLNLRPELALDDCLRLGPCELPKLDPSSGGNDDEFGSHVDIRGDTLAISAPRYSTIDDDGGAVFIFQFDDGEWRWRQTITAADGQEDDRFGWSLTFAGDQLLVGASFDDGAFEDTGSVYVFEFDGDEWAQVDKFEASDSSIEARFGETMAVDGETLLVGAPFDAAAGVRTGAVYVLEREDGQWVERQKVVPFNAVDLSRFGVALDIEGEHAIVGASTFEGDKVGRGIAYAMRRVEGMWTPLQILAPLVPTALDFGSPVKICGNAVVIADGNDNEQGSGTGAVYVFEFDGFIWRETQRLTLADGAGSDDFGDAIATTEELLLIGAPGRDVGASDTGAVFAYDRVGDVWVPREKLVPTDADQAWRFGSAIAVEPGIDVTLIGAKGAEPVGAGAAYVAVGLLGVDCNGNDNPDFCDISDGISSDTNGNGIPDECETTLGDIDGDGDVDATDLILLLGAWGACDDCGNCVADLDGDCNVGSADLIILLGNWG